ncbi:serine acetyltransferase [candidate division KSB1 bacterium]|nr:serine acetyltransferase [candidate division KSB1 bacterium]
MSGVSKKLMSVSKKIADTYEKDGGINRIDEINLPTLGNVVSILDDFIDLLFPGYFSDRVPARANILFYVQSRIDSLFLRCVDEFIRALRFECKTKDCDHRACDALAEQNVLQLIDRIPTVRAMLKMDILAGDEGDPAAKGPHEIISCYPYVYAIATHRLAHEIYNMNVPLIPRMMSEWSHRRTGIDIHPGAKIGKRFFIDHGTGVVIGETTEIGDDVKLYQGVTLGALSFRKNPDGSVVKGGKRHPTIQDRVTIYSGATILGGKTVIGKDSVIGANTWITSSVTPGTLVTFQEKQKYQSL